MPSQPYPGGAPGAASITSAAASAAFLAEQKQSNELGKIAGVLSICFVVTSECTCSNHHP